MILTTKIPVTEIVLDTKSQEYTISDKYEVYKKLTIENQIKIWQAEIAQYEAEKEPTIEELIELGKQYHPYYMNQERKQELIERIKSYEIKEVKPVILK